MHFFQQQSNNVCDASYLWKLMPKAVVGCNVVKMSSDLILIWRVTLPESATHVSNLACHIAWVCTTCFAKFVTTKVNLSTIHPKVIVYKYWYLGGIKYLRSQVWNSLVSFLKFHRTHTRMLQFDNTPCYCTSNITRSRVSANTTNLTIAFWWQLLPGFMPRIFPCFSIFLEIFHLQHSSSSQNSYWDCYGSFDEQWLFSVKFARFRNFFDFAQIWGILESDKLWEIQCWRVADGKDESW